MEHRIPILVFASLLCFVFSTKRKRVVFFSDWKKKITVSNLKLYKLLYFNDKYKPNKNSVCCPASVNTEEFEKQQIRH